MKLQISAGVIAVALESNLSMFASMIKDLFVLREIDFSRFAYE